MCDLDGTQLDESISYHRRHCPVCMHHLTSLMLCCECGIRHYNDYIETDCNNVPFFFPAEAIDAEDQ